MDLSEFRATVTVADPPGNLTGPLLALWHDARGAWDTAHQILQDEPGPAGCWVHAYLHRVEGDENNAGHWYNRAARPHCTTTLPEEWETIATELLKEIGQGKPEAR